MIITYRNADRKIHEFVQNEDISKFIAAFSSTFELLRNVVPKCPQKGISRTINLTLGIH